MEPPGGLVVKQRGPEVTDRGVKTGRKAWLEVERHPTLLAFADAHGLADDL